MATASKTTTQPVYAHPDYSIETRIKKIELFRESAATAPIPQRNELDGLVEGEWTADKYAATRTKSVQNNPAEMGDKSFFSQSGVDWDKVISQAVETANGNIELSSRGLTEIPSSISDLRHLILLATRPTTATQPARSFNRISSAPLNFNSGPSNESSPPRSLHRTASGSLNYTSATSASAELDSVVPLNLYFANNSLTTSSLPPAFFDLDNLTVLSLRGNKLEVLPEGIGRLARLVELNLGGNNLRYLPAEILRLPKLRSLFLAGNNFISPPESSPSLSVAPATTSSPLRLLGPLIVHFRLPSLVEITNRLLLSYDVFETTTRSIVLEPSPRAQLPEHLLEPFVTSLTSSSSFVTSSSSKKLEERVYDPLANICRSSHHNGVEKVFVEPSVSRLEWIEERSLRCGGVGYSASHGGGARMVPILHRGCSRNCLDWLEKEQDSA